MKATYNILHCINALSLGGAERRLVETLRYLDRDRFKHVVCYLYPRSDLVEEIASLGIPVIGLRLRGKRDWLRGLHRLRQVIADHKVDLIHTYLLDGSLCGRLAGASAGIPIVSTLSSTADATERFQADPGLLRWKFRLGWMFDVWTGRVFNTRYIAVSDAVKRSAVESLGLPSDRIEVIYRGLAPQELNNAKTSQDSLEELKAELGLGDAYPVLINVGRLVPVKGQRDLIRAMPFILPHFLTAKFLIVGDGPLGSELERERDALGLENQVIFLGQRQDVKALLRLSTVFLLASYYEGAAGAVMEAMAMGQPVVAFCLDTLTELVEHGRSGLLVEPRDPERLAEAVVRLASDPQLMRTMGQRGRQIMRERFDIRQKVKQLERVYETILECRKWKVESGHLHGIGQDRQEPEVNC